MSERRRLRAGQSAVDESGMVPVRLRRFVEAEWIEDGPFDSVAAHRLWGTERQRWAEANGYDPKAPYGTAPGRDWWAFLKRCDDEERGAR